MDFDIGTILYVVITLVAVIIGVLGKKKKPGRTASDGGVQAGGSFLENFERAMNMERDDRTMGAAEPVEEEFEGREIREEPLNVENYDAPYAGRTVNQEGTATGRGSLLDEYERIMGREIMDEGGAAQEGQSSTESIDVLELDDQSGTDYFEIVKDFDAGTAVVYSAIINRVEY